MHLQSNYIPFLKESQSFLISLQCLITFLRTNAIQYNILYIVEREDIPIVGISPGQNWANLEDDNVLTAIKTSDIDPPIEPVIKSTNEINNELKFGK